VGEVRVCDTNARDFVARFNCCTVIFAGLYFHMLLVDRIYTTYEKKTRWFIEGQNNIQRDIYLVYKRIKAKKSVQRG